MGLENMIEEATVLWGGIHLADGEEAKVDRTLRRLGTWTVSFGISLKNWL
jgi:hypothetical protein